MSELNERNLENVAGGAGSGKRFDPAAWIRQNCNVCEGKCSASKRAARLSHAESHWNMGEDWDCPYKS